MLLLFPTLYCMSRPFHPPYPRNIWKETEETFPDIYLALFSRHVSSP